MMTSIQGQVVRLSIRRDTFADLTSAPLKKIERSGLLFAGQVDDDAVFGIYDRMTSFDDIDQERRDSLQHAARVDAVNLPEIVASYLMGTLLPAAVLPDSDAAADREAERAALAAKAASAAALTTWSKPTDLARPSNFVALSLLNLVQLNAALSGQTTTMQALVDRVNVLAAQVAAQSATLDALGATVATSVDYLLGD